MKMPMHLFRWLASRLSIVVVVFAVLGRLLKAWRGRGADAARRRRSEHETLPSLAVVYPHATRAPRRRVGVRSVPLDRIVGTLRSPSQNTADFLPLRRLRGQNWRARWQRISRATERLELLPPVDLVQVGDDYWVEDGHNRVAAARRAGAVEIDADVTQLLIPDHMPAERGWMDTSAVVGGEALRQAGRGRHSRTVEQRNVSDSTSRSDLLRREDDAQ